MNTSRFVILLLLFAFIPCLSHAQQTMYYQSSSPDIQKAKELYINRDYISALNQFERIASMAEDNSDIKAEAMFYKALCGLKLNNANGEEQIADFIIKFPESTFRNRAMFEQAVYQFDKKKYAAVLKTLDQLRKVDLNKR